MGQAEVRHGPRQWRGGLIHTQERSSEPLESDDGAQHAGRGDRLPQALCSSTIFTHAAPCHAVLLRWCVIRCTHHTLGTDARVVRDPSPSPSLERRGQWAKILVCIDVRARRVARLGLALSRSRRARETSLFLQKRKSLVFTFSRFCPVFSRLSTLGGWATVLSLAAPFRR